MRPTPTLRLTSVAPRNPPILPWTQTMYPTPSNISSTRQLTYLVAGMVALPIITVQTVQSRVTVARTGTIKISGHTYRTTTRISHIVLNLSKNAHRSSQMHLATYQKMFYHLVLIFFIVILAGFLLTCFVFFF